MESAIKDLAGALRLPQIRDILRRKQAEKFGYLKTKVSPGHKAGYAIMFVIGVVMAIPFGVIALVGLGFPPFGWLTSLASIFIGFMLPFWMGRVALPADKPYPYKHHDTICPYCYQPQVTSDLSLYWKCGFCGEEIVRYRRELWKIEDIIFEEDFLLNCARYELIGGGEL